MTASDTIVRHSQALAERAAKLDDSINRFLSGMDAHQARLDGYASEVEQLKSRIADLEKRLVDSGR